MNDVADRALKILRELRSVTFATTKDGLPQARIADVMGYENGRLLCVVGNNKPFYRQLKETGKVAIVGMTPNFVVVRLVGDIQFVEDAVRDRVFDLNPDLANLFPDEEGQKCLAPYVIYRGKGEIFDLSRTRGKLYRERFAFGGESVHPAGFRINENCTACGTCQPVCPFDAIAEGDPYYVIDPSRCDECGTCYSVCPSEAIELPTGM
jgi:uncharacterized pyridoxamine 5'-phosphate oxidase family protein/NAD-dependent dihydropyrimidine dehydrogenase PreA subunit